MRVEQHPILGPLNTEVVRFQFNGKDYEGRNGESIASALLANGVRTLRYSEEKNEPRGIYCGIGHCYECRVTVGSKRSIRACMTEIQEGMKIESQGG
ncbi:sarcosine oxidase alpha subunit [Geomicrobium sp. JCM 19038]|nr:sarcosine oxidase alpha subunit [Geomicrobium sp. JCM 19038]